MIDFDNSLIYLGKKEEPFYSYEVKWINLDISEKEYQQYPNNETILRTTKQLILLELEKYYFSLYYSQEANNNKLKNLEDIKAYFHSINKIDVLHRVYTKQYLEMRNKPNVDKKYFYSKEFEDYKDSFIKPIILNTFEEILNSINSEIEILSNMKAWEYAPIELDISTAESLEESLTSNQKPIKIENVIFKNIVNLLKRDYEYQKEDYKSKVSRLNKTAPNKYRYQLQDEKQSLKREYESKNFRNYKDKTKQLFKTNKIKVDTTH